MIVGAANYLICFQNCVISHQWLKQFFERNPKYHIRKQKLLGVEQKLLGAEQKHGHIVNDMNNYFEKIEWIIRKKRITKFEYIQDRLLN